MARLLPKIDPPRPEGCTCPVCRDLAFAAQSFEVCMTMTLADFRSMRAHIKTCPEAQARLEAGKRQIEESGWEARAIPWWVPAEKIERESV